jgi:hypothetical protein
VYITSEIIESTGHSTLYVQEEAKVMTAGSLIIAISVRMTAVSSLPSHKSLDKV